MSLFAGTVFLGLHLHTGCTPAAAVRLMRHEAVHAEAAGFDGVGISEHHAGFPTYMPSPLTMSTVLLGDLGHAFAVPCPLLLPLRPVAVVAEELAWLAATYPGRVGAGVAPGYQRSDFAAAGAPFDDRLPRFWSDLEVLCADLRGEVAAARSGDPALQACRTTPVSVVAAVGGPMGARRAAARGAGMLLVSHADPAALAMLVDAHAAAGGPSLRVLIRRIWMGSTPPPSGDLADAYAHASGVRGASWLPSGTGHVITGGAGELIERLAAGVIAAGATSLNLRVHSTGTDAHSVREQIEMLGRDVLPAVRRAVGWAPSQRDAQEGLGDVGAGEHLRGGPHPQGAAEVDDEQAVAVP